MKIKEIEKTVHLAWSPKCHYPLHLVAGSAAEEFNVSNSSSALELYEVDPNDGFFNPKIRCAFKSKHRFHKLIWSDYGDELENSIIVGGCDAGVLLLYNAGILFRNELTDYERLPTEQDGLIACLSNHSGPVRGLDFNPFQKYLLATGASQSEIFIWDLNKDRSPMTPGAPAQPLDDVVSLSWNKEVKHIIASTFSTRCLIWDLRKNQPIIKLPDFTSTIRWKDMKWNPQNATQLCLASEEDQYPVIQMYDLRSASSPIKIFEGHQKGILSLAWGSEDPDHLISCGKDDKLLVWNTNTASTTGEIVNEVALGNEWNFEVNRCPRNPHIVSCSSYGRFSLFSFADRAPQPVANELQQTLSEGHVENHIQQPVSLPVQPASYTQQPVSSVHHAVNQIQQPVLSVDSVANLQHSEVPSDASSLKQMPIQQTPSAHLKKTSGVSFAFGGKLVSFGSEENRIYVSRAITDVDLDEKLKAFDEALKEGDVGSYCETRARLSNDPILKSAWSFISASQFSGDDFKERMYNLLGISQPSLEKKLNELNIHDDAANEESNISHVIRRNSANNSSACAKPSVEVIRTEGIEGAISEALLLGNIELAVDLCLKSGKMADAMALAVSGGAELIAKTRARYFEKSDNPLTTLISAVATEDWRNVVDTCDISNWKQVIVALLTYTKNEEFLQLCESLGRRLSTEGGENLKKDSLICYICSGNVNEFVERWKSIRTGSVAEIQEIAELGLLMEKTAKKRFGRVVPMNEALTDVLSQYALFLTSQECLEKAYSYLSDSQEDDIKMLKERLMYALDLKIDRAEIPVYDSTDRNNVEQPRRDSAQTNRVEMLQSDSVYGERAEMNQRNSAETEKQEIPHSNAKGYFQSQNSYEIPLTNHDAVKFSDLPKSVVKPFNEMNPDSSIPSLISKPPVFSPTKPANAVSPPVASVKAYSFKETPAHISPYTFSLESAPASTKANEADQMAAHISPYTFSPESAPASTKANESDQTSAHISPYIFSPESAPASINAIESDQTSAHVSPYTFSPESAPASTKTNESDQMSASCSNHVSPLLFTPHFATEPSFTSNPVSTYGTSSAISSQTSGSAAIFTPSTESVSTPQIPTIPVLPSASVSNPRAEIAPILYNNPLSSSVPPSVGTSAPAPATFARSFTTPSLFTPSTALDPRISSALFTPTVTPSVPGSTTEQAVSQFTQFIGTGMSQLTEASATLPPPPASSQVPYGGVRKTPDYLQKNNVVMPTTMLPPISSQVPDNTTHNIPDHVMQNKATILPPTLSSSQIPYNDNNDALNTPDHVMQSNTTALPTKLPPAALSSQVPYNNARSTPDHIMQSNTTASTSTFLPPPSSQVSYNNARSTPDHIMQSNTTALPTTLPPPPLSSQVPYNNARSTPDHVMQSNTTALPATLPPPPSSQVSYNNARSTPDHIMQSNTTALPTTFPPPPLSSQVPYNNARSTQDHVIQSNTTALHATLPPPPSSQVSYNNARSTPDHIMQNNTTALHATLPPPPSSQVSYNNARSTPDHVMQGNTTALHATLPPPPSSQVSYNNTSTPTLPPPPSSSQVPYHNARKTPDYMMQSKNRYVIDPSLVSGTAQRYSPYGNFSPSPEKPNQPPMNPVASFPSSNETLVHQKQGVNYSHSMSPQIPNLQTTPAQVPQPLPSGIQEIPLSPSTADWNNTGPGGFGECAPDRVGIATGSPSTVGWNDPASMAFQKSVPKQVDYNSSTPMSRSSYGSTVAAENTNTTFATSKVSTGPAGGYGLPNTSNGVTPLTQTIESTPKPKPPLPEEHIKLQRIFDELHKLCFNATSNPHMKRKLNDITGRLEILYDAIRVGKLSQSTLQGLHEIVNAIEAGKYEECLPMQTKLISKCGPDFTTIASFMPGIKVLVYSAMQLGVRL